MTSKDPEIQKLYNKIAQFKPIRIEDRECKDEEKKKNCSKLDILKKMENDLPTLSELEYLINKTLSIKRDFMTKIKWNEPLDRFGISNTNKWGDQTYQVVFIDYGLRILMDKNFILKIGILEQVLLKKNGVDKPLRLTHIDDKNFQIHEGPYLYITKLPLHCLIFNQPKSDFNVEIHNRDIRRNLSEIGYFKFNNLEEAVLNAL